MTSDQNTPTEEFTNATIKTRHPEKYILIDGESGHHWALTPDGRWVRAPHSVAAKPLAAKILLEFADELEQQKQGIPDLLIAGMASHLRAKAERLTAEAEGTPEVGQ